MKHVSNRQQDIIRKATRIYNLVKANRDEDAGAELRGFGPDAVALAIALLMGEGRTTRIEKVRSRFALIIQITLPILFSFLMFKRFGVPPNDASLWFWWYVSLTGVGYIAEFVIGDQLRWKAINHRSLYPLIQPDYRTNEIVCQYLVGARGSRPVVLEGLLLAGNAVPRPSEATRHDVDTALLKMLDSYDRERLLELNDNVRNALCLRFHQIANSPPVNPPNTWSGSCIPTRDPLITDHALVGTAILNMFDDNDGFVMIDNVRRLAGASCYLDSKTSQQTVISKKRVCLSYSGTLARD